ncbi:MAG: alpha-galactosidase [Anaerolineae bacterium]|nr:alpha-galactosidase [Anaerolineae bacterium]
MTIIADDTGWILQTAHVAYALGINEAGYLVHRYWGARLPHPDDYPPPPESAGWVSFNGPGQMLPEEYPAYAGLKYVEPCLKATFADGVRDVALRFDHAEVNDDNLDLHLRDDHYPLRLTLHYRVHPDHDLIERSASLINDGGAPIMLERVLSAQWHPPQQPRYRLSHLSGRWSDEFNLHRDDLPQGVTRLESRRLTTSHHHSPWFALDDGRSTEDTGDVWFGALAWSGNWLLLAEATDYGSARISLGLNDWDFAWQLDPGETLTTPAAYAGWTDGGFGAASRILHGFIRAQLPHGERPHPILYNSWEATNFDVSEEGQAQLAEIAAALGVELFVMDDGWFKGRLWENAGLGDWTPDPVKFPHGLTPLIDRVKALGMAFGLWIEPEMVNPDSDLYREHPDWVIHFPTRERTTARNQLILNLARPDVQNYLIAQFDALLREHDITFIKWDMNRNASEPGWPDAPRDQRELWLRYVQGLYRVWGTLRERHPDVLWQSCSGGGGRADLGILRYADQIWVSDNTEATARLRIQDGFSQCFPALVMEAWVTDAGRGQVPLDFRFHVSMSGVLAIGGNLLTWSEEERATAARWVAYYKQIREIVQLGDQYRLLSAHEGPYSAIQYMDKEADHGVLFAYRVWLPDPALLPVIRLRGLIPDARYEIQGVEGERSGLAWMHDGLRLPLANLESTVRTIRRVGAI